MGYRLHDNNKSDLENIGRMYGNRIVFYDIEAEQFSSFSTTKQWNIATYFRLLMPQLIAEEIERIIYFDCDITCRGSIRELYETKLEGNIIGAVEDHVMSPRMSLSYLNGINPDLFYFNAGMLVIDLAKWRKEKITERCFDYLMKHKPMHLDQDALNAVLQGKWKHLPYRWNFMADFHSAYFGEKEFDMDMSKSYPYYPTIIHFTGVKPWDSASRSVYKADFYKYQELTIWKNMIPIHTKKEMITNMLRLVADKLGLKKAIPWKRYDFKF